ncbi:hypothetical protein SEUBUCD646_0J03460 [Saccharomyces eubayanus]|uniref:Uncharacterized protein n=1 Tax=Saccharomyces eubayanus TaxID=1080349 RepID=A0ABN8VFP7_SACEU|nr:hypothetical protein SEUBUCD650_0J03450 [Saccharomyces eubayanus]CAI1547624.1 hypothetical protein SEUBUCD646_0J03460 [Saccharomyces eubayanus]
MSKGYFKPEEHLYLRTDLNLFIVAFGDIKVTGVDNQ